MSKQLKKKDDALYKYYIDRDYIMNEVYVQLWNSINNYNLDKSFQAWLHGITINQINSLKRRFIKLY